MPPSPKRWFHITLTTHGAWLHGDPRGFRSRDHRIHSCGDYKDRPPAGEHENLHQYMQRQSSGAVVIAPDLRPVIGQVLLRKSTEQQHRALAVGVGGMHAHLQVELPDDLAQAKRLAGQWKQASSHAVREQLPGKVWAQGGKPIPIRDRRHHANVYGYILDHVREGAWVWSFREALPWVKAEK